MDAAIKHCSAGISIWPWASNDQGGEPRRWWNRRRQSCASDFSIVNISGCGDSAENRYSLSVRQARRRVLVCIDGDGQLKHNGAIYTVGKSDVLLLPAVVGACVCPPRGTVRLL